MNNELKIMPVSELNTADIKVFSSLLMDVVESGASIGFLPQLSEKEAGDYWKSILAPEVRIWSAEFKGEMMGTVQLHLSSKQNGLHRAEIAKLMVHPKARRLGIGRKLMETAEKTAKQENRSLLVLDTREGDPSNHLYRSLGYIEAGRIPQYARSADGELHETVFYYKILKS